jgi:hypothetical protein
MTRNGFWRLEELIEHGWTSFESRGCQLKELQNLCVVNLEQTLHFGDRKARRNISAENTYPKKCFMKHFLGFCWYWRRTRKGRWSVACKTRRARLARAIQAVYAWCRENRHLPVKQQHETLTRKVQGHINYFGVNGNMDSLDRFVRQVRRSWFKWLNRRSQRARLTWERYTDLLVDLPLPKTRITVTIWR